jgi:hypothetical protein
MQIECHLGSSHRFWDSDSEISVEWEHWDSPRLVSTATQRMSGKSYSSPIEQINLEQSHTGTERTFLAWNNVSRENVERAIPNLAFAQGNCRLRSESMELMAPSSQSNRKLEDDFRYDRRRNSHPLDTRVFVYYRFSIFIHSVNLMRHKRENQIHESSPP